MGHQRVVGPVAEEVKLDPAHGQLFPVLIIGTGLDDKSLDDLRTLSGPLRPVPPGGDPNRAHLTQVGEETAPHILAQVLKRLSALPADLQVIGVPDPVGIEEFLVRPPG